MASESELPLALARQIAIIGWQRIASDSESESPDIIISRNNGTDWQAAGRLRQSRSPAAGSHGHRLHYVNQVSVQCPGRVTAPRPRPVGGMEAHTSTPSENNIGTRRQTARVGPIKKPFGRNVTCAATASLDFFIK